MKYLIEFETKSITPVTIEAETEQEAVERALKQEGSAGDTYYKDMEIVEIRPLEG